MRSLPTLGSVPGPTIRCTRGRGRGAVSEGDVTLGCACVSRFDSWAAAALVPKAAEAPVRADRKSTRLNSSHLGISYAVFCLKKKKTQRDEREEEKKDSQEVLVKGGWSSDAVGCRVVRLGTHMGAARIRRNGRRYDILGGCAEC